MKLTTSSNIPVYTISGSSTARPLPEWLARKRKRSLKQDPEYANRIELLQDFEFEEASSCVRVSEDGDWVVSTGTYKPQMHIHYLPHLSLSYMRHTNTLNTTFILLSSDYSKSLHLQSDRSLEFHTPEACRHATRIPRYGRDLKYDRWSAEALIPSVGVNGEGNGEVYRLNLELGRFMTPYSVDVGGDDYTTTGGGSLQGGIGSGSVNCAAIGETSHNLLAFGTSLGTVEFWDPRSRSRVGILPPTPALASAYNDPLLPNTRPEITCLEFKSSGLTLATGTSTGLIHLYDLRSPTPLLRKDQGYGYPIHTLTFLDTPSSGSTSTAGNLTASDKILSSDKRIIKIWDAQTGAPWTSVEPAVDLNSVAWCPGSGMLLTANEGRQQHSFFIPSLGPAPKWCSFLDNLVEEMAEDSADPLAYTSTSGSTHKAGEIYDNYRFVSVPELRALNLDHLVGRTGLLKPMMHGYLVNQQLYEEAKLISQPEVWAERRQKSIREKIEKERESRIRGSKKAVTAKVNKRLAERIIDREEKNERRKAKRALEKGGDDEDPALEKENVEEEEEVGEKTEQTSRANILTDSRFSALFQNDEFAIDETSHEFRALNPSTNVSLPSKDITRTRRGLTAVEEEELEPRRHNRDSDDSGSSDSDDEDEEDGEDGGKRRGGGGKANKFTIKEKKAPAKVSSAAYTKKGHEPQNAYSAKKQAQGPEMRVSSSNTNGRPTAVKRDRSFGSRVEKVRGDGGRRRDASGGSKEVVGEKSISFVPGGGTKKGKFGRRDTQADYDGGGGGGGGRNGGGGAGGGRRVDRRSASGNTFRRM